MPALLDLFFLCPHHSIFGWVVRVVGKDAVEVLEKDHPCVKDFFWVEMFVNDLDYLIFRDSMDETSQNVGQEVVADRFLVDNAGAHLKLPLLPGHHVTFDVRGHAFAETPGTDNYISLTRLVHDITSG